MAAKRSTKSATAAAPQSSKKTATTPAIAVEQQSDASEQRNSDRDEQSDNDASAGESGTDDEQPQSDNGDDDNGDDDDGLDLDDPAQDGNDDGEEEEELDAVGFGDAMSKILGQNVAEDAQPILAKRTTARMREILAEKKTIKTARTSAAEKREKEQKDMVVPSHATAVADRRLRAIATKGVVALFNAIEKHQHQSGKPTDATNDKRVKEMSKDNFLGLLKAQQQAVAAAAPAAATATTARSSSSWAVVQDDYMMGAKLKDWDATHGTEKGRTRNVDTAETEAAEDAAWRQVGDLVSDDDSGATANATTAANKRKGAKTKTSERRPAPKKTKRS